MLPASVFYEIRKFANVVLQSRCMHNVQHAFRRLQSDLDPLAKPIPTPSATTSLPASTKQQQKLPNRRVPNPEDVHATNRIISHVLRKVRRHTCLQHHSIQLCCLSKTAITSALLRILVDIQSTLRLLSWQFGSPMFWCCITAVH